jgi:hypothetical protein
VHSTSGTALEQSTEHPVVEQKSIRADLHSTGRGRSQISGTKDFVFGSVGSSVAAVGSCERRLDGMSRRPIDKMRSVPDAVWSEFKLHTGSPACANFEAHVPRMRPGLARDGISGVFHPARRQLE